MSIHNVHIAKATEPCVQSSNVWREECLQREHMMKEKKKEKTEADADGVHPILSHVAEKKCGEHNRVATDVDLESL